MRRRTNAPLNPEVLLAWPFESVTERYDEKRAILYALGVGADSSDLTLVYERRLKALPTMAVVLAGDGNWMSDPRTGITFTHVLHGEQKLEIHKPLAGQGVIVGKTSIDGLYDKGAKGAVLIVKRDLVDGENGEAVATIRSSAFLRADGGFGGKSEGQPAPHPVPDGAPDTAVELKTYADQALIYRLSGDYNPLHIDPAVANQAGFERPILHGLCSYGVAGRALIKSCCAGDPHRLRRLDVRFSAPVFPGETLVTEIWREAPGRAAFRVKVKERDVVALNNGRADYLV